MTKFSVFWEHLPSLQKDLIYAFAWWTWNGTAIFLNESIWDVSEKLYFTQCKCSLFFINRRWYNFDILLLTIWSGVLSQTFFPFELWKDPNLKFSVFILLLVICTVVSWHALFFCGGIIATAMFIGGSVCKIYAHTVSNISLGSSWVNYQDLEIILLVADISLD